jgi:four helix bundle suffix protein
LIFDSMEGMEVKFRVMTESESLLPPHGGYRNLKSFQVAQLAYDVTVRFCNRYIDRRSRTHDQMVQAARSGVQNIAEGSKMAGTSKKMELKLTNVANASLDELRLDYEDFLRQRGLTLWTKGDPRRAWLIARRCTTAEAVAAWVREVREREKNGLDGPNGPKAPPKPRAVSIQSTSSIQSNPPAYSEIAANAAHTLVVVAASLLNRQTAAQAAAFEKEGGFTERLYRIRTTRRLR